MKSEHPKRFLTMKTITAKPDLVKKMREIRDKLSLEIMDMSLEQEQEFLKSQLAEIKSRKHKKSHAG